MKVGDKVTSDWNGTGGRLTHHEVVAMKDDPTFQGGRAVRVYPKLRNSSQFAWISIDWFQVSNNKEVVE